MNYHVVTPYARFQNLVPQIRMMEPFKVYWDLLLDDDTPFRIWVPGDWVRVFYFPPVKPFWKAWQMHLNRYITTVPIIDEDRYCVMNDDDAYEPGFFDKISKHSADIVLCSMLRGQRTPPEAEPVHAHGTETLVACPENVQVCHIGCEQMICSGRVFSTIRFAEHQNADGMAIVEACSKHRVEYAPEAFAWFNYYEPGRWNKT